jgi:hypothetical protein
MLLLCGELYMKAHAPAGVFLDPDNAVVKARNKKCRECLKPFLSYAQEVCEPCKLSRQAPVVHADVLQKLRLEGADWETLAVGLADLDVAMRRISNRAKAGISQFVELGPQAIEASYVEFRIGHAPHVLEVWRAINARGEFSESLD